MKKIEEILAAYMMINSDVLTEDEWTTLTNLLNEVKLLNRGHILEALKYCLTQTTTSDIQIFDDMTLDEQLLELHMLIKFFDKE